MKKLIMLGLGVAMLSPLLAQESTSPPVRETYRDATYYQTTVVVKEKGTSDLDILNDNFDIEEYSMGEVIRITTGQDGSPVVQKSTSAPQAAKTAKPTEAAQEAKAVPAALVVQTSVEEMPSRATQIKIQTEPKPTTMPVKLVSNTSPAQQVETKKETIKAIGSGPSPVKTTMVKKTSKVKSSSTSSRSSRSSSSSTKKVKKRKGFKLFNFSKKQKRKKFRGKRWGCYSF